MRMKEIIHVDRKLTGSFYEGFISSLAAFRIVSGGKGYLKYFFIPFLLNIVILLSIFYFSFSILQPWLSSFLQGDSWIYTILRNILGPMIVFFTAIISVMIYSVVGSIVTAPFNDFLSLKVEKDIGKEKFDEKLSLAVVLGDISRVALNLLKLLGMLIAANLLLLLLNFLPLIGNVLYSILSFLMTAFFLGFQFFDFPLERRRLAFSDKVKLTWRYKFMVMGLGMSFFLMTLIPVVGFLGLNIATIGATLLFIDNIKPVMKVTPGKKKDKVKKE